MKLRNSHHFRLFTICSLFSWENISFFFCIAVFCKIRMQRCFWHSSWKKCFKCFSSSWNIFNFCTQLFQFQIINTLWLSTQYFAVFFPRDLNSILLLFFSICIYLFIWKGISTNWIKNILFHISFVKNRN